MRFSLAEVTALTGAVVERWSGPEAALQPTALTGGDPGGLWFAMRPRSAALPKDGVAGVVLFPGEPAPPPPVGVLRSPSPPLAFYRLADEARSRSAAVVAAVTGSSGKSSTKEFLAAILGARYRVTATGDSLNRISDCAELLLAHGGGPDEAVVIEMGFGRVGDIATMAAMARPHVGIITNVTPDHLDGAGGSWETYALEKGRLGHAIVPGGSLVINGEDPGCGLLPRAEYQCRVLTFGTGPGVDARFSNVAVTEMGTRFELSLGGSGPLDCCLPAFGGVQAANGAAAALAAHALGLTEQEILRGLGSAPRLPRRFAVHRFSAGLTVIDDTFSANANAMMEGLATAAALAGGRRKLAVLSGIALLEQRAEELHRAIGHRVAEAGYDELFLVRPDGRTAALRAGALAAGMAPERIHEIAPATSVAATLLPLMEPRTLLYAKCSQYLWVGPEIDRLLAAVPGRGFTLL